ncbi:hypothetical protein, partial [Acetobacter indonesiensis]
MQDIPTNVMTRLKSPIKSPQNQENPALKRYAVSISLSLRYNCQRPKTKTAKQSSRSSQTRQDLNRLGEAVSIPTPTTRQHKIYTP